MGETEINAFVTHLAVDGPRQRVHADPGSERAALSLPPRPPEGAARPPHRHPRQDAPAACPTVLTRAEVRSVIGRMYGTPTPRRDPSLRHRHAPARGPAPARQGRRVRQQPHPRPRHQGQARPRRSLPGGRPRRHCRRGSPASAASTPTTSPKASAPSSSPTPSPASTPAPSATGAGSSSSPAEHMSTDPRTQLVRRHHLHETAVQRALARGRRRARHLPARQLPHLPPLFRDPPARGGVRYPHHPGALGPPGREDDDDLHTRLEPRRPRRAQPCRSSVDAKRRCSPSEPYPTDFAA